jgi:vancomycin resistance protein YoaR
VVALAILVDSVLYYNNVHAGVSVAGQDVSGLTPEEAQAQLDEMVGEVQQNSITLTADGKTWEIMPADMGTRMDTAGAVAQAMEVSRAGNIFSDLGKRLDLYFNAVDIPLTGAIDDEMADAKLAEIATELNVAPVDAGLAIEDGKIKVIEDKLGQEVDVDALREELRGLLTTMHSTEVAIPLKEIPPEVTAEDNAEAQALAETMISAPITLTGGDKKWTITPDQIVSYMAFTTKMENGVETLVPYLDAAKMEPLFTSMADEVATKPVNATFQSDGKKAWVVPGVLGKKLDTAKTAEAVSQASTQTSSRSIEVGYATTEPERTTEEAEAMGVKDLLATYTDSYAGSANRQVNVRITTEYASNVFLAPGDVYNFDKQIGPRTAARGYKTAPGIVGPGKLEDVFGGGICEVSTALFNAVFFAGLEVVERKNHSIFIDHYPKGRDATVSAGGPNLRFRNDTGHYIWIRGSSDGITTTFNIYGTSEGRKVKYSVGDFYNVVGRSTVTVSNPNLPAGTKNVLVSGQSGKQLKTVRTVTAADGSVIHKDTFISTYPMVPQQIEVGTASTTTTTKKPTTTTTGGTTSTTKPPTTTTTAPPTTGTTAF